MDRPCCWRTDVGFRTLLLLLDEREGIAWFDDVLTLAATRYGPGQTRERLFRGVTRDLIEGCEPPWLTIH